MRRCMSKTSHVQAAAKTAMTLSISGESARRGQGTRRDTTLQARHLLTQPGLSTNQGNTPYKAVALSIGQKKKKKKKMFVTLIDHPTSCGKLQIIKATYLQLLHGSKMLSC
jgi:hypothetical protein